MFSSTLLLYLDIANVDLVSFISYFSVLLNEFLFVLRLKMQITQNISTISFSCLCVFLFFFFSSFFFGSHFTHAHAYARHTRIYIYTYTTVHVYQTHTHTHTCKDTNTLDTKDTYTRSTILLPLLPCKLCKLVERFEARRNNRRTLDPSVRQKVLCSIYLYPREGGRLAGGVYIQRKFTV